MADPVHTTLRTKGDSFQFKKFVRTQDVVEVNKRELHELSALDWQAQLQLLFGQFFIAGGIWLGIERYFERAENEPVFTPIFSICVGCMIAGLGLLVFGITSWRMKAGKIKAIFEEMEEETPPEE